MLGTIKQKNMYTVANRPYKLIANTRRGISQKVDPLETSVCNRELMKCGNQVDVSLPKPVFHHQSNGKKAQSQKVHQENYPAQYEELIKHMQDSWTTVQKDNEVTKHSNENCKVPKVVRYEDLCEEPHSSLADFKPFDLESFWGERFLRNIQQST